MGRPDNALRPGDLVVISENCEWAWDPQLDHFSFNSDSGIPDVMVKRGEHGLVTKVVTNIAVVFFVTAWRRVALLSDELVVVVPADALRDPSGTLRRSSGLDQGRPV